MKHWLGGRLRSNDERRACSTPKAEAQSRQMEAFRARAQLPSGQLSVIVGPGAWTYLMGESLAGQLCRRVFEAGRRPRQIQMNFVGV